MRLNPAAWMLGTVIGSILGWFLISPYLTVFSILWIIGNLGLCYIYLGLTYETD
jgi:hypothetical protein